MLPFQCFQGIIYHIFSHGTYSQQDTDSAKNKPQNISQLIFNPLMIRLMNYEFEKKGAEIAIASEFEVLC